MLKLLRRVTGINKSNYQPIMSIGFDGSFKQPRALLSYLTDALDERNIGFQFSTNRVECQVILSQLLSLGYIVDFFDCRDSFPSNKESYDLVLGFGAAYRSAKLKPNGIKVLYLTESAPQFSLENEKDRCTYFKLRHQKVAPIERSGTYYLDDDLKICDHIICLGELHKEYIINNQLCNGRVYSINPSGLPVEHKKNEFEINKDYLWFGSRGIIHKGLDILIDTFKELPDFTLHVCGVDYKDVRKLMVVPDNIIFHGKVSVKGETFKELCELCNFSILLSCSEAVATSVLTCMRAGMIPIVSDKCGTKFFKSIVCNKVDITSVKHTILESSKLSALEIEEKSTSIALYADKHYSLEAFRVSIHKAFLNLGL